MPGNTVSEQTQSTMLEEENISQKAIIHHIRIFLHHRLKQLKVERAWLMAAQREPGAIETFREIQQKQKINNQSILSCELTLNELIGQRGMCSGLTKLWLYAQWLSSQPIKPERRDLKRDDADWFYSMASFITQLDKNKLNSLSKEESSELDHFIEQVTFFQNRSKKLISKNQNKLEHYILDSNGRAPTREYAIGGLFTQSNLAKILSRIILYPNKLIYIKINNHAIGLFKTADNQLVFYNSNNKKKPIVRDCYNDLAKKIFSSTRNNNSTLVPMAINIFSMDDEKKLYPEVRDILAKNNVQENTSKYRSLNMAVLADSIESVSFYLSQGHDINRENENKNTPLILAIKANFLGMVAYLIKQQGLDINKVSLNGKTPLINAIKIGNNEIIALLLLHPEIDVNYADKNDKTILMHAIESGDDTILKLLLRHPKIDVNKRSENYLPIMATIFHKNPNLVKLLLSHQDIQLSEKIEDNLFTLAITSRNIEIINLFLDNKSLKPHHVNKEGGTSFLHAIETKKWAVIEAILFHPNFNIKNEPQVIQNYFFDFLNKNPEVQEKYKQKLAENSQNQLSPNKLTGKRGSYSPKNKENVKKIKILENTDFTQTPPSADVTLQSSDLPPISIIGSPKKNIPGFFKCNETLSYSLTIPTPRIRFSIR